MKIEIDDKIYNNIEQYCKLNNLDIKAEINKILLIGFNITKYGVKPFHNDAQIDENSLLGNKENIENKETVENKVINKIRIIKHD